MFWQTAKATLLDFLHITTSRKTNTGLLVGSRQARQLADEQFCCMLLLHIACSCYSPSLYLHLDFVLQDLVPLHLVQVLRDEKIFTDPNSDYNGINSATDGDLDAAYAMLLAGQKWHEQSYTDNGIKVRPEPMCKLGLYCRQLQSAKHCLTTSSA